MGNILCSSDREPIYSVSWCGTIVSGLVVEIVAVGLKVGGVGWCRWALHTEAEDIMHRSRSPYFFGQE
jgi:hypothetical protein